VALTVALKELLAVALGSVEGLTLRPLAAFTISVYVWLPITPAVLLSVAEMVNVAEPVLVGVPLSTPVLVFRTSQDGIPAVAANV
jgi:hypothetical protein